MNELYHLNPIQREIARRYCFENISYSEDIDWAMRICRDRALKREFFIDEVIYYYYYSRRSWDYQRVLDFTEHIRHALGIQMANRIRLRKWVEAQIRGKSGWKKGI